MLINHDENCKTKVLGLLINCRNCGVQLIPNIGLEILLESAIDYGKNPVYPFLYIKCPICLETHQFVEYE